MIFGPLDFLTQLATLVALAHTRDSDVQAMVSESQAQVRSRTHSDPPDEYPHQSSRLVTVHFINKMSSALKVKSKNYSVFLEPFRH